ncbi:AAA family ATPase [Curtobacterium sp. VKM Ac-2861]|nr:AAA family ATPase [Curtobacterium sp. VKM Ac-2861]
MVRYSGLEPQDTLHGPGRALDDRPLATAAAKELDTGKSLDAGQANAAAAVAGTDRLVAVIGPAGAGKTTLLKVARRALEEQGRQMVVVAPTKKAASVASREIGTTGSSLHRLPMDYGFQWDTDRRTGRTIWSRRPEKQWKPSVKDAFEYGRSFPLRAGDRIVVDEASMVDLDAAHALAVVARETGAGIRWSGTSTRRCPSAMPARWPCSRGAPPPPWSCPPCTGSATRPTPRGRTLPTRTSPSGCGPRRRTPPPASSTSSLPAATCRWPRTSRRCATGWWRSTSTSPAAGRASRS